MEAAAEVAHMIQTDGGSVEPETPAPEKPSAGAAAAADTAMLETDDEDLRLALQMSMVSLSAPVAGDQHQVQYAFRNQATSGCKTICRAGCAFRLQKAIGLLCTSAMWLLMGVSWCVLQRRALGNWHCRETLRERAPQQAAAARVAWRTCCRTVST